MNIETVQGLIVAAIQAALPSLKTCEPHPGKFDANELKRVAGRAPAIYVAALAINNVESVHGDISGLVTWGAFVITRGGDSITRANEASALALALSLLVPENTWGTELAEGYPQDLRAQNLYSAGTDKTGIAMWGVSWRQKVNVGTQADIATLANFVEWNADHSLVAGNDEPAAVDQVQLPQ